MSKHIIDRLPMRSEGRWSKYGGLQVIVLADFPSVEERWVRFNFIQEIYNISNRIQPWRSPTDLDLFKFEMDQEAAIKKLGLTQ